MHKKLIMLLAVSLTELCFFHCSSLDQYTGVGEDIIKETDPDFMDIEGNFFAVSLDSSCIEAAHSLPEKSGSGN